jgi:hypothetical protein
LIAEFWRDLTLPRADSSNGDYHGGPNGDGSSNASGDGNGSPARADVLTYRPVRRRADPRYSYRGLGWLSGIILAGSAAMAGGMLIAWGGDPVVRILVLLFLSATIAVAGAVAGIVLVPLGLSRNRPGLWVTGLIVGVISFAAMITAIGWALRAQSLGAR